MGYTRENGGAAIAAEAKRLLGIGYSEQSPVGSDGDGHDWMPGERWPTKLDCSGTVVVVLRSVGLHAISNGSAEDQWLQHLGGIVHPSEVLRVGDIGAFLGVNNTPGYAGHTGVVTEFDHMTHEGVLLSAYDTQLGVCDIRFSRLQHDNGTNGLGVVGFYRPANRFPVSQPGPGPRPA